MIRYKKLVYSGLGFIGFLLLLMLPQTTWSDKQQHLLADSSPQISDQISKYELLEEDFYLYLQSNLGPNSHNQQYMLSENFKRTHTITLSDVVGTPPAWCNQHFADLE